MDINVITQIISQVGFPIFVAVWMLYKTSKDSEIMNTTIQDLRNAITELTTLLKEDEKTNE